MFLPLCDDNAYGPISVSLYSLVRPASREKPAVETLRWMIRVADMVQDSVETLETCMAGVDTLISVVSGPVLLQQKNVMTITTTTYKEKSI
jgi:hypothetical protein